MDALSNTKCLVCNEGYAPFNGACVALPTGCLFGEKVRNIFSGVNDYKNFDCYSCAANFIYNPSDKVCLSYPSYPLYCNNMTLVFAN